MPNCVICNREVSKGSFNMKDKYELAGGGFICKTCAERIGIKGFMSAGFLNTQKVRKKYFEMYPDEAQANDLIVNDDSILDSQFIKKINEIPNCKIILEKELKILRRALNKDEEVIHAIEGLVEKNSVPLFDGKIVIKSSKSVKEMWLVALTSSRMILANKQLLVGAECVSLPLESIRSVSHRVGLVVSSVTIMHGESGIVIENVAQDRGKVFVGKANEAIRNIRRSQVAQAPVATPVSAADELVKWHSLLQQGIITQEEFNAQKEKILR